MAKYRRKPDIVETAVENDLFLVAPKIEGVFHLNAVGSALWKLLAEPRSHEEILRTLNLAFADIPAGQIERDVDVFLEHLEGAGLIENAG